MVNFLSRQILNRRLPSRRVSARIPLVSREPANSHCERIACFRIESDCHRGGFDNTNLVRIVDVPSSTD